MDIAVGKAAIYEAAEKLSNWGRWGEDDQVGTVNHIDTGDAELVFVTVEFLDSANAALPVPREVRAKAA